MPVINIMLGLTQKFFSISAKCKKGTWSVNGYEPCDKCPVGFYAAAEMSKACTACDPDKTTDLEGADDPAKCLDKS